MIEMETYAQTHVSNRWKAVHWASPHLLTVHYCVTDCPKLGGLEPPTQFLWIRISRVVWLVTLNFALFCEVAVQRLLGLQSSGGSAGSENCFHHVHFMWLQADAQASPRPVPHLPGPLPGVLSVLTTGQQASLGRSHPKGRMAEAALSLTARPQVTHCHLHRPLWIFLLSLACGGKGRHWA